MARRHLALALCAAACGPAVSVDGEGDSSTGGPTTGAPTATTTSSTATAPDPTAADVTTAAPTTSAPEPTTDDGTDATDGDTTGEPYECGCPPNTVVGPDEQLPSGETPMEVLARFQDLTLPLTWFAYGDATSPVRVDAQYRGGVIELGPGGEDGCQFLSVPCFDGVQMDVVVSVNSDDGWLRFEAPAELQGFADDAILTTGVAIDDNTGTLADQPLVIAEVPVTLDTIGVVVEYGVETQSGYRGQVFGEVSEPGCGGECVDDPDCGADQMCIDGLCLGGMCGELELLGEI